MENLDVINTKTCKICNETKDLLKFDIKRNQCKVCLSDLQRKNRYLKIGITIIPKKRRFNEPIEEKKIRLNLDCKNRSRNLVKNLNDEYLINVIRINAIYDKIKPDFSEENILKTRKRIKKKRLKRILNLNAIKKICKCCKETIEKTNFRKNVCVCRKCNNFKINENRKKFGPKKYALSKKNLTNTYIKTKIQKSCYNSGFKIKCANISQEFIELTRKQLTLKRKIKNENKQRSS